MNLSLAKALDRRAGGLLCRLGGLADGVAGLWRPPPPPIEDVRRVLAIKFWGVGNWALLRPVLRDLRERWPSARLAVLTLASNEPLARDLADDLLLLRTTSLGALARDLCGAWRRLVRLAPEMSVDFEQFSTAGALLARAAGVAQRVGFSSGVGARDALLTVRVPFRRDAHAGRSFRDLAEAAGVAAGPYVPGGLEPSPRGLAEAAAVVAEAGPAAAGEPLLVVHPGSGDNFPGRRWSVAGFAAVARHAVLRFGARVLVTGSAAERSLGEAVARPAGPRATCVAGRLSLDGLVGLLSACDLLLSNDTGPVHLASALGRPVVALFGPNTPVLYGPQSAGSRTFYKALPCSPCLTVDNYRSSRCRIHTCMAAISTGEVVAAVEGALARAVAAGRRPPWAVASR